MTVCECVETCSFDGFLPATRELMVFTKAKKRYFDLDAVREPYKFPNHPQLGKSYKGNKWRETATGGDYGVRSENPLGAPPLDWWLIDPTESTELPEGKPMTATMYIGDVLDVLGKLPENSVDLVLSSPPFLALRSYLPADHPDKSKEGGSQSTPGEYIDWLIDVVEACDRVLAPHGSLCFELGDTYAGSGGAGGDYNEQGIRAGQPRWDGSVRLGHGVYVEGVGRLQSGNGWPLPKSLSLIPESFRFAMVYGFNPFTGRQTERWRLRNVIRWVRPNPPVGALGDKFRPATSELMVFCKSAKRYFDLDAVREPHKEPWRSQPGIPEGTGLGRPEVGADRYSERIYNPAGAPPLDWWNIPLLEGEEPKKMGPKPRPPRTTTGGKQIGRNVAGNDADPNYRPNYEDRPLNPAGAPPLDWWNIPPGGYEGAHYAVWPPELLIKPIKAMCPEKVCRTCGEARRRIVATQPKLDEQRALAAHIKERRNALGVHRLDMAAWFPHYRSPHSFDAQISNWELAKNVPSPGDWSILKERLGVSADFDDLVNGDRRWTESEVAYLTENGEALVPGGRRVAYDRGGFPPGEASRIKANRQAPHEWTDCGHADFRNGVVLDPFVGSGTTLAVASGHGRDSIGIDLDERNYELALQRVGPLVLQREEVPA